MLKLTRDQTETIGLLFVGTFLEYFNLMLFLDISLSHE